MKGAAESFAQKRDALEARLAELNSLAVAFSGGVDSSVLLHAARNVLGERAVAVIADSPSLPRRELAEARELAGALGVRLAVVATEEGADERYQRNRGDRCYFCKAALFDVMQAFVRREGIRYMAFGEITDDLSDDRPGARAASEYGVVAPLREAGFSKRDVRRYAADVGLAVADKPASACLASRIPVGTRVTAERLATVESAEEALRELGLRQLRVRHLGARARVEVGADEYERAQVLSREIALRLSPFGFSSFELAVYGVAPTGV